MTAPQAFWFSSLDERVLAMIRASRARALWRARLNWGASLLHAFLSHATSTVPFYKHVTMLRDVANLSSLPLVDRALIQTEPQLFLSESFAPDDCAWYHTSGSTGVPLAVPFDAASLYGDVHGALGLLRPLFPALRRNIDAGETAMVIVNDNPSRRPRSDASPELGGAVVHFVVLGRSEQMDESLIHRLRDRRIPLLAGRPRALLRVLDAIGGTPQAAIRPDAVLCTGDNLHEDERRRLSLGFAAPVHNGYASREGGLVGVECHQQRGLHVFADRTHVEVLTEPADCSAEGEGELVVTNPVNWAMPFLRYRTSDIGRVEADDCGCGYRGRSIVRLHGRDSIYFELGSRRFNPSLLNPLFDELPIAQYQVVQECSGDLTVRWVAGAVDAFGEIHARLQVSFSELLPGVTTRIERVDRLARPDQKVQRYVRQHAPCPA